MFNVELINDNIEFTYSDLDDYLKLRPVA